MAKNIGQLPTPSDTNVNTVAEQQIYDSNSGKGKTRRSTRPKKETKRYGDTTNLDFLDPSDEDEPPQKGTQQASHHTHHRKQQWGTRQHHQPIVQFQ